MNDTVILSNNEADWAIKESVFVPSQHFVSTKVQKIVEIFLDYCLTLSFAFFGIVSNVIIIIVFGKQGYKESVNITMTAIAVWDLAKCLAASMQRMAGPMQLISKADAEGWTNVSVVVFSYLICFSSYVSSVLAAFVAIERCLCVSMPFKVKDIITPRVTLISCLVISIGVFGAFVVMWSIYDILWVYHPGYNRSILIYRYNDFFYRKGGPIFEYYNMSGMIWPIVCFIIISVCTVIIVYYLRVSSHFRTGGLNEASGEGDSKRLSKRDRQVVKMLLVIIIVYIISLSPRIALYLAKYFIYEFYFLRRYHNLLMIISYTIFFFDIFNSAVNLLIFLFMSSSFRATFMTLFPCLVSKGASKANINRKVVAKSKARNVIPSSVKALTLKQ